MSRGSNPIKVEQWRRRLERFSRSGQTVVQFCRAERVSQPSFYHWRKELARHAAAANASDTKSARPAFQAVEIAALLPSATTVRLANGVEIELGGDLRVVQAVVKQLLEAAPGGAGATGGRPC